ncbi:MAG: molybdenum cofactor biosynthesis protein, partial [Proteobacteria bacterium]|nr:molybdenum cofactor biosynthesis protein [Pseudomonadota bacterium]
MAVDNTRKFIQLGMAVLTVSDTRTENDDKSGQLLVKRLETAGHRLIEKQIVPDDKFHIRAVISKWCINNDIQVILTTGGTGVTGR